MWQISKYSHSTGQDEDYLVSVYKSYQGKQHKNNRKKMKALMFDIFLSQYLVHARPQNSFDFLGPFPESARRSFTNINQKREHNSANTVHSKKILSTDREEFFKSFYSNISLLWKRRQRLKSHFKNWTGSKWFHG